MSDPRLAGRIAVVTGGGRGLGRALVRALAGEGADVAFSYRESRRGALEEAEAVRRLGRRAFAGPADARVPGEIAAFVDEAAAALGGLDFLVNNVGVFRRTPLEELSEEVLDEAFDVNVKAAVVASRAAAPHMKRRGSGAIVNVASLGGLRPWPAHLAYCASKAALVMATQCLGGGVWAQRLVRPEVHWGASTRWLRGSWSRRARRKLSSSGCRPCASGRSPRWRTPWFSCWRAAPTRRAR
jgi:NAD(P)-dependent dehydrogenase (short-subunit alcohol dehydrogenase family)